MRKCFLFLLAVISFYSCTDKQIASTSNQSEQTQKQQTEGNQSLISVIDSKISKAKINDEAILILNGIEIDKEELEWLNQLQLKDFTDVTAVNKEAAIKIYGDKGRNGAIIITPFTDELLYMKYYSDLKNEVVINTIEEYNKKGLINKNPLLVINGVPLRGEEIANKINALEQNDISKIALLKKQTAYSIYGIRAMNGVLLIDTQ